MKDPIGMDDKTIRHHGKAYSPSEIEALVQNYYKGVFNRRSDRHVQMKCILPELEPSAVILDYGTGMGGIANEFSTMYKCRVDAVDISDNELEKARIAFGENSLINFMSLTDMTDHVGFYDMIFCSMVAEHIHNLGNFLSRINRLLKRGGVFVVGIPNIVNMGRLFLLLGLSQKRAIHHSKQMINGYDKAHHHINGWDPIHFITLLASCGFELEAYIPTEGIPLPGWGLFRKIPLIGKLMPELIRFNIPILNRLSYTTFYRFKKVKDCEITTNE